MLTFYPQAVYADRLISAGATVGDSLTLTSDGTNLTLTPSPADAHLKLNDQLGQTIVESWPSNSATYGYSSRGARIKGRLFVGLTPLNIYGSGPPGVYGNLVTINDSMTTGVWSTALNVNPTMDADIGPFSIADVICANYGSYYGGFGSFDCTDGNTTEPSLAWNEDWGAVVDTEYGISGTSYLCQTFFSSTARLKTNHVQFRCYRVGNPGTIGFNLYAVNASHKPTGAALGFGTLDVSAITTDSSGEWINISISSYNLTPSTEYALRIFVNGAGTLMVLADSTDGDVGSGWMSSDSGSTWSALTSGGDLLYAVIAKTGSSYNFTGQRINITGDLSSNPMVGFPISCRMLDIYHSVSGAATSTPWPEMVGVDIRALYFSGPVTKSYGIRIQSAGSGAVSWGLASAADVQIHTVKKLLFGKAAGTMGTNWIKSDASTTAILAFGVNNADAWKLSATALYPVGTIRTQTLGQATTQGLLGIFLQDTAASFTLQLQTTNTGIAANKTLTFDVASLSRTLVFTGLSATTITLSDWFNQNVKDTAQPTYAGVVFSDAGNIVLGTSTGSKWGTATNQKQAWWNATPVVQPSDPGVLADSGGGTADGEVVDVGSSFDQATLNDNFKELTTKYNTLRTLLRTVGLAA